MRQNDCILLTNEVEELFLAITRGELVDKLDSGLKDGVEGDDDGDKECSEQFDNNENNEQMIIDQSILMRMIIRVGKYGSQEDDNGDDDGEDENS